MKSVECKPGKTGSGGGSRAANPKTDNASASASGDVSGSGSSGSRGTTRLCRWCQCRFRRIPHRKTGPGPTCTDSFARVRNDDSGSGSQHHPSATHSIIRTYYIYAPHTPHGCTIRRRCSCIQGAWADSSVRTEETAGSGTNSSKAGSRWVGGERTDSSLGHRHRPRDWDRNRGLVPLITTTVTVALFASLMPMRSLACFSVWVHLTRRHDFARGRFGDDAYSRRSLTRPASLSIPFISL